MMNTMYSTTGMTGIWSGFFWLHLHWLFGAFTIVGFILFTVWALKNLSGSALKSVTMWLLGIGIIGVLLTAPFAAQGFQSMMKLHSGYGLGGGMMNNPMMGHDEEAEDEQHDEHAEMEEMMRRMMNQ